MTAPFPDAASLAATLVEVQTVEAAVRVLLRTTERVTAELEEQRERLLELKEKLLAHQGR